MRNRKYLERIAGAGICVLGVLGLTFGAYQFHASAESEISPQVITVEKDTAKPLGSSENPMMILEVVPDETLAEIGWLIPGCEPIGEEGMADLVINDKVIGDYQSHFTKKNSAGDSIASMEEKTTTLFPDELAEGSKVYFNDWEGNPDPVLKKVKEMLPVCEMLLTAQDRGAWILDTASSNTPRSGYYKRVQDTTGNFRLNVQENPLGTPVSEFVFDKEKGNYIWVSAENTENIPEDITSNTVWTTRTGPVFHYKQYVITHHDHMIKSAFGTDSSNFKTVVKTLTPQDLQNTQNLKLIEQADMIYFHIGKTGGCVKLYEEYHPGVTQQYASFTENDISWETVTKVLERQSGSNPAAVVLDAGAVMGSEPATGNGVNTEANVHKLSLMLTQFGPSYFKETFLKDVTTYTRADGVISGQYAPNAQRGEKQWKPDTFLSAWNKYPTIVPYFPIESGLYEHTYVYNGDLSMMDDYIGGSYSDSSRWDDVYDYYENLNGARPSKISPNDVIEYLFNQFKNVKTTLSILEIQPCNQFIYGNKGWESYYLAIFPWFTGDIKENVQVTTMTTAQFIGTIEDLNAKYDMILIGGNQNATNGLKGYNDRRLQNFIYTSIGDMIRPSGSFVGAEKGIEYSQNMRYSGNDITGRKLEELKKFLNGKKPIVFDEGLYENNAVKAAAFDKSSFMYQLAQMYGTKSQDVNTEYMFVRDSISLSDGSSERLKKSLSKESCKLEFYTEDGGTGYPTEYKYTTKTDGSIDAVTYQGSSTFSYHFRIMGDANQTFGLKLYIDTDGDGVYAGSLKEVLKAGAATEEVQSITVLDETGNTVEVSSLKAGTWYQATRVLDSGYVGILPWKLEAYDVTNEKIRDNKIQYAAIRTAAENRQKVRVLQMNLTGDMKSNVSGGFLNMSKNKKFQDYLKSVAEYNVEITFLENQEWTQKFIKGIKKPQDSINKWKEYLDTYDMIILGFRDMCMFTNQEVFYEGFQDFVKQGKSVILSHDIVKDTSFLVTDGYSTTKYDQYTRDLLGQRRYNSQFVKINEQQWVPLLHSTKEYNDYSLGAGNGRTAIFDNNTKLYLWFTDATKRAKSDRDSFVNLGSSWGSQDRSTSYIGLANQGQITEYPFKIPKVIEVSPTHVQNYQLNLEDADMVSWYNLTDEYSKMYQKGIAEITNKTVEEKNLGRGLYSSIDGDSRNSYYIYNKGNITYTGMGHNTGQNIPDNEVKLFINTMISSYRLAAAKPGVEVTNPDATTKGNEITLYVPLDENIEVADNEALDIDFKVTDYSLVDISNRSYTLQYLDEEGNIIKVDTYPRGTQGSSAPVWDETNQKYHVTKDTPYYFQVPYSQVKEKGYVKYQLVTESSYINEKGNLINTSKTDNVYVYPMYLFNLN